MWLAKVKCTALAALTLTLVAVADAPRDGDVHGDPLPPDALARLGTTRLRHAGQIEALAFAPDGKCFASLGSDCLLHLWETATGKELGRVAVLRPGRSAAAFSPDGKLLAVATNNGTISLWPIDRTSGTAKLGEEVVSLFDSQEQAVRDQLLREQLEEILRARDRDSKPLTEEDILALRKLKAKPPPAVCFLAFAADGALFSGHTDGVVRVWDVVVGKELRCFGEAADKPPRFALSRDGKVCAVAREKTIAVWDAAEGKKLRSFDGTCTIRSLAFSPDAKRLASGDEDLNKVRLWDVTKGTELRQLDGRKEEGELRGMGDSVTGLAFAPDGKTLYAVGDYADGTVRVWNADDGKERASLHASPLDGKVLALSPDGGLLAMGGGNHTVRLWDTATGKEPLAVLGSQGAVGRVLLSADGKQAITASSDGEIRFWDRATGRELRRLGGYGRVLNAIALAPDGKTLAVGAPYEPTRIVDAVSGKEIHRVEEPQGFWADDLAFSPDGTVLAVVEAGAGVRLCDPATGKSLRMLPAHNATPRAVFSPDGKTLALGGFRENVPLWDVATGKEREPVLAENAVSLAFSPDGRTLATADPNGRVRWWNPATGQELQPSLQRGAMIRALAFSPDGQVLASGDDHHGVALWETRTGRVIRTFAGHAGPVASVVFTPDGRSLLSGSSDATALVWDATGRQADGKLRPADLKPADLDRLWQDLASEESPVADKAVWMLASAPGQAEPFLQPGLKADAATDARRIARLIAELDDDAFAVRERAAGDLARLGRRAETALKEAREHSSSAEVRQRATDLLIKLEGAPRSNERLRLTRAVRVLEQLATKASRELLEGMATGGPTAEAQDDARAALARLAKRNK